MTNTSNINDDDIDLYIENQIIHYNKTISSKKFVLTEARRRYKLFASCLLNKNQIKETKHYLLKKFIKDTVYRVLEINNSYQPATVYGTYSKNHVYYSLD